MKTFFAVILAVSLTFRIGQSADFMPGELMVVFKPSTVASLSRDGAGVIRCGISKIDSVNSANNFRKFYPSGHAGIPETRNDYIVVFPENADLLALAAAYMTDPNVKWAHPNYIAKAFVTPNDSLFDRKDLGSNYQARDSSQWSMDSLHLRMERAWDNTKGDTNVVIAMIDVGVFWKHVDIGETYGSIPGRTGFLIANSTPRERIPT